MYLEALSAETSYRTWRKYRRVRREETLAGQARPSAQSEILFDNLVEHAGSKYHGYVMQSIAALSKASKKQRFYPTLVAQYHGLSAGGIDLLSSFGLLMPSSSFYRERGRALTDVTNNIQYVLSYWFLPISVS